MPISFIAGPGHSSSEDGFGDHAYVHGDVPLGDFGYLEGNTNAWQSGIHVSSYGLLLEDFPEQLFGDAPVVLGVEIFVIKPGIP